MKTLGPSNWFRPGRLVHGDHFFGRRKELRQLSERMAHGQSVLIVGERRIGKSSLLMESYRRLSGEIPKDYLYLDGPSLGTGGRLLASLTAYLKDQASSDAPSHRVNSDDDVDTDTFMRAIKRSRRDGKQLTIFINDLDDLIASSPEVEEGRRLTSFLRAIIERGHIVVCGVAFRKVIVEPSSVMHAPLFNVFYPITLRSFSEVESLDLLTTNSRRSDSELTVPECHFVMELAGRKPFHLQEFGFRLMTIDAFRESSSVKRLELLEEAANDFAEALEEHWVYIIKNLSPDQLAALVSATREEPVDDLASYSYLIERGLLDEGDSQFSAMGSLFHAFIRRFDIESDDKRVRADAIATMRGMADSAIKAAISAAVKALIS